MDREVWHAVIHVVTKSRTWLRDGTELNWTELNWRYYRVLLQLGSKFIKFFLLYVDLKIEMLVKPVNFDVLIFEEILTSVPLDKYILDYIGFSKLKITRGPSVSCIFDDLKKKKKIIPGKESEVSWIKFHSLKNLIKFSKYLFFIYGAIRACLVGQIVKKSAFNWETSVHSLG